MEELPADKLYNRINLAELDFKTTEDVEPLVGTIGQERAIHAIDFGLRIKTKGFNLYIAGPTGTGKHSTIEAFVKEAAIEKGTPSDWCYVYNFAEPDKPLAIELPAGAGAMLAHDMDELIDDCLAEIPRAFESEEYEKRKNVIVSEFQSKRDLIVNDLRQKADEFGFSVEITAAGIFTFPIVNGEALRQENFNELPDKEKEDIKKNKDNLQDKISHLLTEIRNLEKKAKNRINKLEREISLFAIGHPLELLVEKYKHIPKVTSYLAGVQSDIIDQVELFKSQEKTVANIIPGLVAGAGTANLDKYKINVFISNENSNSAPVIFETNPTYYNIFGRLEYKAQLGAMTTDFTMIKPGAVHRANGGYLILNALDLLMALFSWEALKRTLDNSQAKIENIGEQYRPIPAATLQPEPIPIDTKVVLIGSPFIYYLLYRYDDNFRKLFKIKADFNWEMDRNKENIIQYAAFISARCSRDHILKHFDRLGVARVIEFGSRLADSQKKLSAKFVEIDNLISEASYWAKKDKSRYVSAQHVKKSIEEKVFRSNLIEKKIQELIDEGTIMIDTTGAVVGQVNGLSIYDFGDYSFGKPTRITCETYIGRGGVINIEREAKLGGKIHNKGVIILSGYLGGKYGSDKPMAMSATVGFEQSYEEVEGDSASSAELYSIISSLSEVPIKQNIAVTGSVNQKGDIQSIGGVNQKIEGFFEICKLNGLSGDQGVIIPRQNQGNLMLKDEVVEAVANGVFHIWPITNIDEGLEILTGLKTGEVSVNGAYPKDTINWRVHECLVAFADRFKEFSETPEPELSKKRPAA